MQELHEGLRKAWKATLRFKKQNITLAIFVFLLVALVHILRMVQDWEAVINGMVIPKWTSILGVLITGGLAFLLWREN